MTTSAQTLLRVKDLCTSFRTEHGMLQAIQNVTFDVHEGETVGLVGESGCGKSVTAESLMRLLDPEVTEYAGQPQKLGLLDHWLLGDEACSL